MATTVSLNHSAEMRPSNLLLFLLAGVAFLSSPTLCTLEREMTVEVPAGGEECFFEAVTAGQILEVEYQVIDGGQQNELEINFKILRPNGVPLIKEFRKSDHTHRKAIDASGDYKICFDNSVSRFHSKIVYFEVVVESDDEEEMDEFGNIEGIERGDYGGDTEVKDIEETLRGIRDRIQRSRHFQDQIRNFEFRDRSMAEHNYERVNFWSTVQVAAMLIAGLVQVCLVRSLFDEKSSLHGLWKRLC